MKIKIFSLPLMLFAVMAIAKNEGSAQTVQHNRKLVHVLKDKNGKLLGDVYMEDFKGDIFNKLLVTKPHGKKTDTLYFINKCIFRNPKGIDITSAEGNFNGYKIEKVLNDSFSLFGIGKPGKGASDPAIIVWNYKKKIFEVDQEF